MVDFAVNMEGDYVSSYRNSRGHHHSGESTDSGEDANNDTAEISDWYLPIVLMDKRHIEKILGTSKSSGTWRMKERVSQMQQNTWLNFGKVVTWFYCKTACYTKNFKHNPMR